MDIEKYLDDFKKNYNGDYSIIYPYIKDRLDSYEDCELPFREEFIFFECRYVGIIEDIRRRGLKANNIIDIGCQLGVQSELFKTQYKYIGIDSYHTNFFNKEDKNCKYINGIYPNIEINYDDSIVISSMSLGYFYDGSEEVYLDNLVQELKKIKHLYIATNRKLLKLLSKYFDMEFIKCLGDREFEDKNMKDVSSNLYYCKNKE